MSKSSKKMPHKYKVISLFSGAMGLDIGLEKTGRFEIIACVEKIPSFCATIRTNQAAGRLSENLKVYEGDITNVDPAKVLKECGLKPGELDLLVGGPPCQSFSTAGRRMATQDPRGTLLWQYLRFVEYMQPRFFLMENVRGLLSAALKHRPIAKRPEKGGPPLEADELPGSVIRLFAEDMQAIKSIGGFGYHMDCFEVNAVNYGAPQLRERAIFIGNRYNAVVDFPDPTHGPSNPKEKSQLSLFDAKNTGKLKPWSTLGEVISNIDNPGDVIMDFSPRKKIFLSLVPPGSNWRSLPVDLQKKSMGKAWLAKGGRSGWWRRLSFDLPCPTLVTMPNHASTSLCHPTEVRALTLKEYALIQQFPINWSFQGTTSQQYAQVGNAVPVRLGEVSGEIIANSLDVLRNSNWLASTKKPIDYRVVYVQSHIRTRQWFKNGKSVIWEDGGNSRVASYDPPHTFRKISTIG